MMLNAFGHCPFGGWIVVNDELTYLAGAHAMHIGEDYGGTKTNSLEVNDELLYLDGTHVMDTPTPWRSTQLCQWPMTEAL